MTNTNTSADPADTIDELYDLIETFFANDRDLILGWLTSPNQYLNNESPNEMLKAGRAGELLEFIKSYMQKTTPVLVS